MADQKKGISVRSELDADELLIARIADKTTPANTVVVSAAGDLSVLAKGTDGSAVLTLRTSEVGHPAIDGFYDVANNTDPSNMGLIAHTRAASPADSDQIKKLTAITNNTVHCLDVSIHQADGSDIGPANPLNVTVGDSGGTDIFDEDDTIGVVDTPGNHDYTVTAAKTLTLKQIVMSASVRGKYQVIASPDGATFTNVVGTFFLNVGIPFVWTLAEHLELANPGVIRVVRTNRDKTDAEMYTTIIGSEA